MQQKLRIAERPLSATVRERCLEAGLPELLADLAARRLPDGTGDIEAIVRPSLKHLPHPERLADANKAARIIADAIESSDLIVLCTDYDSDGVTANWVARRALVNFFNVEQERVVSVIGERRAGYGITDAVCDEIESLPGKVALVISADQGSSDEPRIKRLKAHGIPVCITDHHQLGPEGPPLSAAAVVNPQRADCGYEKTIAGVAVLFLMMCLVRQELIRRGTLSNDAPKLTPLLKNVALGTIADCVGLDTAVNRALVRAGLQLINRFDDPAWQAMRALLGTERAPFDAELLSFQVASRINAASRVANAYTALNFLLSEDCDSARVHLARLDQDNKERRRIEAEMLDLAMAAALPKAVPGKCSLVVAIDGHPGVQGIVASRIAERFGVPSCVLTRIDDSIFSGSLRAGLDEVDIHTVLETIDALYPGMLKSYGGHRAAGGLRLTTDGLQSFEDAFEQAVRTQIGPAEPAPLLLTDGKLDEDSLTLRTVETLDTLQPYGRGWPAPQYDNVFLIKSIRYVGETGEHAQLVLETLDERRLRGIFFRGRDTLTEMRPGTIARFVYTPTANRYRGGVTLQLLVRHVEAV